MKREEFALALNALLPGCDPEAAEKWTEFAAECVDHEQFVYNTIATATGMSRNTAIKSISTLLEMGLITVEASSYFDKRGLKWKGNNLYTILPVSVAVEEFHRRQIRQLDAEVERRKAQAQLSRLCAVQKPHFTAG